jgi:hypothetical protein
MKKVFMIGLAIKAEENPDGWTAKPKSLVAGKKEKNAKAIQHVVQH